MDARTPDQLAADEHQTVIIKLLMDWEIDHGGGLTLRQFVDQIQLRHGPAVANEWLESYRFGLRMAEHNPFEE